MGMKYMVFFIMSLGTAFGGHLLAQDTASFFEETDSFMKRYVTDGKVDYKALVADPSKLDAILENASSIRVSTTNKDVYLAFWINAYNLTVIKGVVDNYPLESPLEVKGFFDTLKYTLGGEWLTLNDIENIKLRARFDEPRFHFVLVCGARGCPPLISKAYLPSTLETQLQSQTVKALNSEAFIKVSDGIVELSEIFKWYRDDFLKSWNTELEFLNHYRSMKVDLGSTIRYYSYDWKLNMK